MSIPNDQILFFLTVPALIAIIIGLIILAITLLLITIPKTRPYFKPLFKFYYYIVMGPLYAVAGIIYAVTFSKVNLFEKFKEINFKEKFEQTYLEPRVIFEDMRVNPTKYHFWVGVYICAVFITIDYILISTLSFMFFGGRDSIIFGVVISGPAITSNPIAFWIYRAVIGNLVFIPTKFFIYFIAVAIHKYDKSDEPDRPWWDKVRLIYIAWGYIIAADVVWCLGMTLSVCFSFIFPYWSVLTFTWVLLIICGLIELVYQQYSLQGLFKMHWLKAFMLWGLSMIPFALTNYLLVDLLGPIMLMGFP